MLKDLKDFLRIYQMAKNPNVITKYDEYQLKTDWIGRPYIFINIPDEFLKYPEETDAYVGNYIRKSVYPVLNRLRIDDILFPITFLDYKNKRALVLFSTNFIVIKNYIKLIFFILFCIILFGMYLKFA